MTPIALSLHLTKPEEKLMKAILKLEFGELYNVEVPHTDTMDIFASAVSPGIYNLITFIRDGNPFLDKIVVHERSPTFVEVHGEIMGYQCLKKIKLS